MTDQTLIDTGALKAALDDPRLLVVDCRFDLADSSWGRRQFDAGHIPGAVYASLETALSGPVTAKSGRHPLPAPDEFARTLGAWGVGADTRLVAYDQGHGAGAARLWWLLRAAGRPQVQVLDGGFAAWSASHFPVSTAPPARQRTTVVPRPFVGSLTAAEMQTALQSRAALLVDARGADRFAGLNETIDPIAGHVPGARNHPFLSNLSTDGRFLPQPVLRQHWLATLAGHNPRDLIAMCGSGVTACQNLLALEVAGLPGGRLYAGSWSEWISDPGHPVATGAA